MDQKLTSEQQEMVLQEFRMKAATMALQQMMENMGGACFKKCIQYPSTSLSSSEQRCLAFCMDRYQDTIGVVSQTLANRSSRQ